MTDNDVDTRLLDADLREQWDALIDWLRLLEDEAYDADTVLPAWKVRDLLAHLGLAMGVLASARPTTAEDADRPRLNLGSYLGSYSDNADGIREKAQEVARDDIAAGLASIEESGDAALDHLARLRDAGTTNVTVRRGVIDLSTLVMTRLVELVVHGDDLARSVAVTSPVDPTARTLVSDALIAVVRRRSGYELDVVDETAWVRLATGRLKWDQRGHAPRSGNLAEGLPDLSSWLPLL